MSNTATKAPHLFPIALGAAALAIALTTGASRASAQCNPVNRVTEAHVPADPPPRDRIDAILERLRNEPHLYQVLGCPTDYFGSSKDGGAFIPFDHGSMYAPPGRGAVEIHGAILDKWAEYEWEFGVLGYPTSDELDWGSEGKYSLFEGGLIIWTEAHGAHAVYGAILDAYRPRQGRLVPTSEEFSSSGGRNDCPAHHRQQNFADVKAPVRHVACWDANTGLVAWHSIGLGTMGPGVASR